MSSPEAMRPYGMLPIPTDLEIVHITLLVVAPGGAVARAPLANTRERENLTRHSMHLQDP